jgi:hypothetical protein
MYFKATINIKEYEKYREIYVKSVLFCHIKVGSSRYFLTFSHFLTYICALFNIDSFFNYGVISFSTGCRVKHCGPVEP